jgi:hypothetical protein
MIGRRPASRFLVWRTLFLSGVLVVAAALLLPMTVYADDCLTDPLNAADCMRTPGYRQTMVFVFSALPTLSAILPNLIQRPPSTPLDTTSPDKQPAEPPLTRYAVQVSDQYLSISPGQTAGLSIKAWKSVEGGPWVPANEVGLAISLSPELSGLSVSPRAGVGEMRCTVAAAAEVTSGQVIMTIQGTAPGVQSSAQVTIDVQAHECELHVSRDRFEIVVGETVELEVSTWRRGPQGTMEPEPQARIRPWLPTEKGFFQWSPPGPYGKGQNELYGEVLFKITAIGARQAEELCFLDFTAIFPNKVELQTRVEIILKAADFEMEFI